MRTLIACGCNIKQCRGCGGQQYGLAGAERSSALQRAILALVMPTPKRHFAPGDLQFLTSRTYRRAMLFETDRLAGLESCLWAAELRSAPACDGVTQVSTNLSWYSRLSIVTSTNGDQAQQDIPNDNQAATGSTKTTWNFQ